MLPNFLVIGVQRCGTTWLNNNLAEHPDIFITAHKGSHFFDTHYEKGIEFYMSFFQDVENQKYYGETEHAYFWGDDIPKKIKATLGEIPMFLLFRHPVDRAYSHFQLRRRRNDYQNIISYDFEESFYQSMKENGSETSHSFYGQQLKKFLEHFPLEKIHIMDLDDIKKDQKKCIKKAYGFLGVDDSFVPHGLFDKNKQSTNVPEGTGKFKEKIFYTSQFATTVRNKLQKLGFTKIQTYRKFSPPPLDLELKIKLSKYFDEDVKLLMALTKKDFSSWLSTYKGS